MDPEKQPALGSKENGPSKTDRILGVLDQLPFAQGGRAGDLTNWHQISESLRGQDFLSVEDFRKAVAEAIKSKDWVSEKIQSTIMGHVDGVVGLVNAWQEKKE